MYVLYSGRLTRGALVEMVLAEAGLSYEVHEIDIFKTNIDSLSFCA